MQQIEGLLNSYHDATINIINNSKEGVYMSYEEYSKYYDNINYDDARR